MSSADETMGLLNGHGANGPLKYEPVTWSRVADDGKGGRTSEGGEKIKTYWWRWVVLAVFTAIVAVNSTIWNTFGSVADVVKCYYGVSDFWVNSLSMVFMLTYLVLILPGLWLINAVGLRATVVIAASCNAIGTGLRMAAVGERNKRTTFHILQYPPGMCSACKYSITVVDLGGVPEPPFALVTVNYFVHRCGMELEYTVINQ